MSQRTENERLIVDYIYEKLSVFECSYVGNREWSFTFAKRESPDFFVFAVDIQYHGDADCPLPTPTTTQVVILVASGDNLAEVTARRETVMAEHLPKPEIILVIKADRPHVDKWTLVSGAYRQTCRDDGDVEFDAFGGNFHWYFEDVYEDVDGIYEQVAA